MGALLDHFAAEGVAIEAAGDGNVRARGPLTDELRATIREHKAAILAELAANEPAIDPDAEGRRNRALAILEDRPEQRIALVAEPGDPAHISCGDSRCRGGRTGNPGRAVQRTGPAHAHAAIRTRLERGGR